MKWKDGGRDWMKYAEVQELLIPTLYIPLIRRERQENMAEWLAQGKDLEGEWGYRGHILGMAGGNLLTSTRYISEHYTCLIVNEKVMGKNLPVSKGAYMILANGNACILWRKQ